MNMRFILLPFLCCISSIYADVWDDLSQAAQVAYTVPLNGEYVRQTQSGIDSFDIYRLRFDNNFAERRVARNGKSYEIMRERNKISFYAPRIEDLQYADSEESNRFPAILPYHAKHLKDSYQASYQGDGRIAGRECHIVRLTPYDENRYTQELCLDNSDNLPLSRIYIDNDTIYRADLFAALDRETPPQTAELTPTQNFSYSFSRTLNDDFSRLGNNNTFIQGLPSGFYIAGYEPNKNGSFYLITDGLVHISLFVEPADSIQNLPNKNGFLSVAVVNDKKHRYTAIGDLPQDGLTRWLQSVEFAD